MRIAVVVGEHSGDLLAAELLASLQAEVPNLKIEGILGPKCLALGGKSLGDMERLNVMGFWDPLKRLPELFLLRRRLIKHWLKTPPNIFLGVDAPDFNLGLERRLKHHGFPIVHYVSPTVWVWRPGRVKTVARAADCLLTLFPFEQQYYKNEAIELHCVGHPLADQIPLIREATHASPTLAVLPGSREREIELLGEDFIKAANYCVQQEKNLTILIPVVSKVHQARLNAIIQSINPRLPVTFFVQNTSEALARADVVLTASGTATLEAVLHKKLMVVAYRVKPMTYWLAKKLIKVKWIAMANWLVGEEIAPEFIQNFNYKQLGDAVLERLQHPEHYQWVIDKCVQTHKALQGGAGTKGAKILCDKLS